MTIDGRYLVGAAAGVAVGALGILFAGPFTSAEVARPTAANTVVACEPTQRAVLRHTVVNGELQVATECAGPAPYAAGTHFNGYVADDGSAGMVRVASRPVATTQAVSLPRRTATRAPATRTESERSWKQTALVIGGSAGAGAGVGAIAGGKKGALIGAAVGGGAASIYEAIKR